MAPDIFHAANANQNARFQSCRFEGDWAGLLSDGFLVLSGEGCCMSGAFVAGRVAV